MSRVNLAALALGAAGAWLVLVGLELAVVPHLVGADGMLALFRWQEELLGMPRSSSSEMEAWMGDPLGFVALTFVAASIPTGTGVALSLGGFLLWRLRGSPADRLAATTADEEPARERSLQRSIRERLARATAADPLPCTEPEGEEALARLDARRRYRLALFLHYAGFDPLPAGLAPAPFASPPGGLATRRRFGPILSFLLLGTAVFALLWGFLSAFSTRLLPEAAGFPPVPHVATAAFTTCAATALAFLLAAWGVLLLRRQDRRLSDRWRAADRATAEIVLAGYDECLELLARAPRVEPATVTGRIVRGLRVAAMEALDGEGKRSLAEIDRARGVEKAGS